MDSQDTPPGIDLKVDLDQVLTAVADGLQPFLPTLVPLLVVLLLLGAPLPGRGPGLRQGRDRWRTYKGAARRTILERAGHRCEGPIAFAWGRCRRAAEQIDHIYPWSKRGATILSNGQALCASHNRRKSNMTPSWWYVLSLERRRRSYYPTDVVVPVRARMTAEDQALRATPVRPRGR